jgi:arylsulfatase I/J
LGVDARLRRQQPLTGLPFFLSLALLADWTSITGGWCSDSSVTDLYGGGGGGAPASPNAPAYGSNNSWLCSQGNQAAGCVYSDDAYTAFAVAAIRAHNASAGPLFLYFAPHAAHQPLEVPQSSLDRFAFMCANDTSSQCANRQSYAAMVNRVDGHIAEIVDALKAAGQWDSTLMTVWADNGGPIYGGSFECKTCDGDAGASNWPLRGGKHSNFEGGVRVNALVSGGLLPAAARGRVLDGLASVEDLFVTFARRAGIDPFDKRGAAAGLPPVEGLDLWPWWSGANASSPRSEVVLGACAGGAADGPTSVQGLIRADGYKLLVDELIDAVWQGPFYPNSTTSWANTPVECGTAGCLYNVFADPTEHVELSASQPSVLAAMLARLGELRQGVFSPHRGAQSALACNATVACRGFVCPFAP